MHRKTCNVGTAQSVYQTALEDRLERKTELRLVLLAACISRDYYQTQERVASVLWKLSGKRDNDGSALRTLDHSAFAAGLRKRTRGRGMVGIAPICMGRALHFMIELYGPA